MIHQSSVYLPSADDEAPAAPARALYLRAGQAQGAAPRLPQHLRRRPGAAGAELSTNLSEVVTVTEAFSL